ncbi:MAG: protein translocase subunit SecD [Gammaproteobacteria bacterium]|nr:protein translocase subunit SecD [Gammaproteobacteria bacterium]
MLNQYPSWKYILLLVVLVVGSLYALPNIYGSDPAIQISATRNNIVDSQVESKALEVLKQVNVNLRRSVLDDKGLLLRFDGVEQQLKAADGLRDALGENYTVALNLAPATPGWLRGMNAKPMYLGLDLRGGLHFLMEVDTELVLRQAMESNANDIRGALRKKKIRYLSVRDNKEQVTVKFRSLVLRDKAMSVVKLELNDLELDDYEEAGAFYFIATLKNTAIVSLKKSALQQNVTTLRNRVNELGVAEPIIQQQGDNRIVIQLPGIQDSARAKRILSATATLEFRLVDVNVSPQDAIEGRIPPTARLYRDREGQPVVLKKRLIITGDRITNASSGFDSESSSPMVSITLDGAGARVMAQTTKKNLKKPMAVVFIEHKETSKMVDGKRVRTTRKVEEVINVATIQGVFSKRFQITGLDDGNEARTLALLLRAGALAAPIRIIEERTIGPSLGADNIAQGLNSVVIGMVFVLVFMLIWYRGFGVVANVALIVNLILIVAVLSMLQATLTLPGIAGIVLTVGMAVDANVLIFERIREEIRVGNTPQASIHAGYDKALSTILDANITTLIAAVVLYIFGTGAIKGFAITLSIGILTSMFTAIMGTRAIINLSVGGKKIKKLSI